MQVHQFDQFTKALASADSRRQQLKVLGGAAGGAALHMFALPCRQII